MWPLFFLFKSQKNTDEENLKKMREGLRNNFFIWPNILVYYFCFVCLNVLFHSQQIFSHDRMISCLPGLIQYSAVDKVSCSRTQHSENR